jgi:hypothetical protein
MLFAPWSGELPSPNAAPDPKPICQTLFSSFTTWDIKAPSGKGAWEWKFAAQVWIKPVDASKDRLASADLGASPLWPGVSWRLPFALLFILRRVKDHE